MMEPFELESMPGYRDQLARVDRLMEIVLSADQLSLSGNLTFEDVIAFTCVSLWHLKDWILNDVNFHADNVDELIADIHRERCLLVCADIANGAKHAVLARPKTAASVSDNQGIHLDSRAGIYQVFYYIDSADPAESYRSMEMRPFLQECRAAWGRIIKRHYMSAIMRQMERAGEDPAARG